MGERESKCNELWRIMIELADCVVRERERAGWFLHNYYNEERFSFQISYSLGFLFNKSGGDYVYGE